MKRNLSNMMIKFFIFCFLISIKISYGSSIDNVYSPAFLGNEVSDFDGDGKDDELNYKCYRAREKEDFPSCIINITTKQRTYHFISMYTWEPIIRSCGRGCLAIVDDVTKNQEMYVEEYEYNKKLDNWIRVKYEIITPDNRIENLLSEEERKQMIDIEGHIYN
ncbi:hypothetical protein EDC44_1315 [Cricetibacter osteomyelitidis]|uniref:Uncharacterized protein n=1 Tax=Cricetibacter osteomyelitidis TaxID=1521931 RepID=A0A4R2SMN0_9PAST|nr:hypothetical protein [Cricetibacter osteomyelitidis]TCP91299.1 hypothetical protein EDC44_1315 [Cricetibacter osteomyelitidis]